jgi:hypothetical protein
MRTLTVISILSLAAGTAGTAAAEDEAGTEPAPPPAPAAKTRTIGLDAGIAMPTGDLADGVGFGFGVLGRFEMPLRPKLVLTARGGYLHHLAKDAPGGIPGGEASKSSTSEILLLGGARYAFSQQPTTAIYGVAELGLVSYRVSVDVGGESMSNSDTNLGMTLGAGYRTGKLDLRAGLFFPDAGELTDAMVLMATVGYDVTAF